MTSAQGISFDVRPSASLTRLLVLVVCLASLAPLFTQLSFTSRCLLSGGIGVFGAWRILRYRQPVVCRVAWVGEDAWTVTGRAGTVATAELVSARRVGRALFLSMRWRGGAGHLALMPDNMPAGTLRLLRSRLGRGG